MWRVKDRIVDTFGLSVNSPSWTYSVYTAGWGVDVSDPDRALRPFSRCYKIYLGKVEFSPKV
jgi:hypothetical protein